MCVAAPEWQYGRDTPGPPPSQNERYDSEAFYRKESPFWLLEMSFLSFRVVLEDDETRGCGACSHANGTRPPQAALGIRDLDYQGQ